MRAIAAEVPEAIVGAGTLRSAADVRAAVAAGADGLIVEVHPSPEHALCDGPQALYSDSFAAWVEDVKRVVDLMGLVMAGGEPVAAGV